MGNMYEIPRKNNIIIFYNIYRKIFIYIYINLLIHCTGLIRSKITIALIIGTYNPRVSSHISLSGIFASRGNDGIIISVSAQRLFRIQRVIIFFSKNYNENEKKPRNRRSGITGLQQSICIHYIL